MPLIRLRDKINNKKSNKNSKHLHPKLNFFFEEKTN